MSTILDKSSTPDLNRWPSVLALSLGEYFNQKEPVLKLWNACDFVELTLRLLVSLGLADFKHKGVPLTRDLVNELKSRVEMPTMGKWQGMAVAVSNHFATCRSISSVPELMSTVKTVLAPLLDGPPHEPFRVETSFRMLRNQLAHGGGVTKMMAKTLADMWLPRFEAILPNLEWLTHIDLIVQTDRENQCYGRLQGLSRDPQPYAISDSGILEKVDELFSGNSDVLVIREQDVMSVWPMITYGVPVSLYQSRAKRQVPMVYARRWATYLEMTPIGSDEVCQSVAGEKAFTVFLDLFRLKEAIADKYYKVRGFEVENQQDAQQLVGRSTELHEIVHDLKEAVDEQDPMSPRRVLWLSGEAGIGKTFMMSWIADQLSQANDAPTITLSDQGPAGEATQIVFPKNTKVLSYRFKTGEDRCSMLSFLYFAVERFEHPKNARHEISDLPPEERTEMFLDRLKQSLAEWSAAGNFAIIFLDGLEEIVEEEPRFAERVPLGILHPRVTWVCSGRPVGRLPDLFSTSRCHHLLKDRLRMRAGDIRSMLLERLGPYMRERLIGADLTEGPEGEKIQNPFIDKVAENAAGLPLYVHYVIKDIQANRLTDFQEPAALPESLNDYHHQLIDHLSLGGANFIAPHLAAFLAVAKEPLTLTALKDMLVRGGLLPAVDEAGEVLNAALTMLGSIISRAATPDQEEGLTFFHRSFRQHMLESNETKLTVMLAQNVLGRLAVDPGDRPAAKYLYRWGITHLLESERADLAVRLLTNFDYLMERLRTLPSPQGVLGISSDWNLVMAEDDLDDLSGIWEDFWRTREHLLLRGGDDWPCHKIFLQLAWEHAQKSPVTIAAEQWLEKTDEVWPWLRLHSDLRPVIAQKSSLKRVLPGHPGDITALALTSDGTRVVSGGSSGMLRIWDSASGELLSEFNAHNGIIQKLTMSFDDRLVLSAGFDAAVRVWDVIKRVRVYNLLGHEKPVIDLAVSPDGRLGASASQDRTIRIWDLTTGKCLHTLVGHKKLVRSVIFIDDGKTLASASLDGCIRIWNVEDGKCLQLLKGHEFGATRVCSIPGGRRIASAGRDMLVRIWDLDSQEPPLVLEGHKKIVEHLWANQRHERLISSGWDHDLYVWDFNTGQCIQTLSGHNDNIKAMALSPDGEVLVSGSDDGTLRIWRMNTGECVQTLEANSDGVLSLAVAGKGQWLASGGADHAIGIWMLASDASAPLIEGHRGEVLSVVVAPEKRRLASLGLDGSVRVWDLRNGKCDKVVKNGSKWYMNTITGTENDLIGLATEENNSLVLYSLEHDRILKKLADNLGSLDFTAISPDGRIALACTGRMLNVWDLDTYERRFRLQVSRTNVTAMTPDWANERVILGHTNGSIGIWGLRDGYSLAPKEMKEGSRKVFILALSHDQRKVAVVTENLCLSMWDLESGERTITCGTLAPSTDTLVLFPDKNYAASYGADMMVRVWDLESGECALQVGVERAPRECPDAFRLLFPFQGTENTCIWVRPPGVFVGRGHGRLAGWVGGAVSHPIISPAAAVFERIGSVSVLRLLWLWEGGRRIA